MEPNLTTFATQYDFATTDFARRQIADKALEYTCKWITEHPELIDREAQIIQKLSKFKMDDMTKARKLREAFNHLRALKDFCAARDVKNSLPQGTSWRGFMDFLRQSWTNMRGTMSNMASNFMRFGSSMGKSAKEIGAGIAGIMVGMASEAGAWITGMLAEYGLTVAGVLGGIAFIALVCVILAIAHHYFTRNKPFKGDALLESYGSSQPHIPYRPQQT